MSADTVTDQYGRFRFPYLKVGPVRDHGPPRGIHGCDARADADRRRRVRPADLAGGWRARHERHRHRGGHGARDRAQSDRRHGLADRGQQSADERAQLPRSRAARARRVSDQRRQHATVRRDVGGAGRRPLRRQPAQFLQQLHRRRSVRERRRGGAERHSVRGGCRRSVPGGHVRRPGGARARARRLRQRRDEERHERAPRRSLRLRARRSLQCRQCAHRHDAADAPESVRREPRRSHRPRSHVLLRERRAAEAGSGRPGHDFGGQRQRDQREAGGCRLSGRADHHRHVSQSGRQHQRAGEGRSSGQRQRSAHRSLQPVQRHVGQLARRRRVERTERLGRSGQHRSDPRVQQHAQPLAADGERDAGADCVQRPQGALRPIPSARRSASRASRRSGRCRAARRGGRTRCTSSSTTCRIRPARMRCARASTCCTTTTSSRIRGRFAAATRFRRSRISSSGVYNNAGFTQTFGAAVVSQTNPNVGVYAPGRVEGRARPHAERRPPLRPAVPADDRHRHEQRRAARGLRLVAERGAAHRRPRQRRALLRPRAAARGRQCHPVGEQHDGPGATCSRTASACRRRRPGRRRFRTS